MSGEMATPLRDLAVRRSKQAAPSRSHYREFAPSLSGSASVALCAWIGTTGWARSLRLFPDACVDLAWTGSDLIAVGPAEAAFSGRLQAATTNIGIRLRPEAAGAILGFPAWALRHRSMRLRDAWPKLAADTEARLARKMSDNDKRLALEAMVAQRASEALAPNAIVCAAVDRLGAGAANIQELTADLAIGERSLREFAELQT
jgi:hypothetical protein